MSTCVHRRTPAARRRRFVILPALAAACLWLALPATARAQDSDSDGMPDSYEISFGCLLPFFNDAAVDYDTDSLTSLQEYTYSASLNPCLADTDGDLASDGLEVTNGANPLSNMIVPGFTRLGSNLMVNPPLGYQSDSPALASSGSIYGVAWRDARNITYEIYFTRISAGGTALSELRLTPAATSAANPNVVWSGSEFCVAFQDTRSGRNQVYVSRISAAGAEIGDDVQVSASPTSSIFPALSVTGSEYGMVWIDNRDGNNEIYFARVGADGVKIGSDLRLTSDSRISYSPRVAWGDTLHGVVWRDTRSGNNDIFFTRVSSSGSKLGSDLPLTTNTGSSDVPDIAWSGSEFGVVWYDNRDGNDEIYFTRVSPAGVQLGDEVRITSRTGSSANPRIAWSGNRFNITWYDTRDGNSEIYLTTISPAGARLYPDTRISYDSQTSVFPALALLGNQVGIAWYGQGSGDWVWFNRLGLDIDGDSLSDADEGPAGTSSTNWDTDGDHMPDGSEARYPCLDPLDGDSQSDPDGEGLVNILELVAGTNPCVTDTDGDGLSDLIEAPGTCALPLQPDTDGDGLLDGVEDANHNGVREAWESSPCATDTDADGMNDADEVAVGSHPADSIILPASYRIGSDSRITTVAGAVGSPYLTFGPGEYGLSWEDSRDGGSDIYFTRVSAMGVEAGDDIRLTTADYEWSNSPAVAWSGSEYGVAWKDSRPSGWYNVYFARVSAAGARIGSEVRLTTYSATGSGGYSDPAIAWNGTDYALVWIDARSPDTGIYFTRVSPGGTEIGDEVRRSPASVDVRKVKMVYTGSEYGLVYGAGTLRFGRMSTVGDQLGGNDTNFASGQNAVITWSGSEYGIAWDNGGRIYFNRVSASGNFPTTNTSITFSSTAHNPGIIWANGFWSIAYDDTRTFPSQIYATLVGWRGNKIGTDLQVSSSPTGGALYPSVAWSGASVAGVAWLDTRHGTGQQYFGRYEIDHDGDGLIRSAETVAGTSPADWDTDDDRVPDGWETTYAACESALISDGAADPDGDGVTNLAEYSAKTNPCNQDTDGDGMKDGWELAYASCSGINPISASSPSADLDLDTLTNLQESVLGSSPCDYDTDGDGLDDHLETIYPLNELLADSDGDGLSDSAEALLWLTDPTSNDTDGDGMTDGWETSHPCLSALIADGGADPDSDGQTNQAEFLADPQTDPCALTDSDSDGMSDWWETNMSDGPGCVLNPAVNDAALDPDGDGRSNLVEYTDRTDPCVSNLLAAAPRLVNYQGRLTNSLGMPASGPVTLSFTLFGVASGGTALWSETHAITVANGIYSVVLGGNTVIPAGALALPELYLQITVGGQALAPRQKITAVPLALEAQRIDGKRFETGARTLTVSPAASQKTVHVSFDHAFTSPPRVTVTFLDGLIGSETFVGSRIFNVTATGFDIEWKSLSGGAASGSATFGYNAFGE